MSQPSHTVPADSAIPEAWVPAVLEKASRLYQQQQNDSDYSLEQLMAAGSEVEIPPALIQQAYAELQQEKAAEALAAERRARQRRKAWKVGGAIAAALTLATALWAGGTYNSLVTAKGTLEAKWAQVENQMQRRADLIPQLTQIADLPAVREENIILSLREAHEAFSSAQTAEEKTVADEKMKSAIANFQAYAADSTQLQSSELLVNLQYEITGAENRIATERMRYNQTVEIYNQQIEKFPTAVVASIFGFEPQPFFGE